jgi:hypothetical protein
MGLINLNTNGNGKEIMKKNLLDAYNIIEILYNGESQR